MKGKDENSVVMVISSFHPIIGGAEIQAERLSCELLKLGWDVTVLTRMPTLEEVVPFADVISGINVIRVNSTIKSKFCSLLYILNAMFIIIRHPHWKIFHSHDLGSPVIISIIGKLLNKGICLTKIRGGKEDYVTWKTHLLKRIVFDVIVHFSDFFIVVSREMYDVLLEQKLPAEKIIHLPNGIDSEHFAPISDAEKHKIRRAFNIPDDKLIFIYTGRLEYVKGVDILIAALQQIPASTRDKIFVLILGDGSEMQSLKRMVVENSLEQYVRFLGMHQNVIEFLHAADIFILPSRSEGLSNSMLEAISCGLPVMCSALGGALTIVSEKETGFLFEPGNSKDLARCILDSLQYISSWIEMGQNGRDKVQNYASLHKIAVEIVQLYKTS